MSAIIIPVAGKSSRFPNMRPKWLLTMPSGKLMYEESVSLLDLSRYDRVIVTCLSEHLEKYADLTLLKKSSAENIASNTEFCVLDQPTGSHAETIYQTLNKMKVKGSFFIKDCDNKFSVDFQSGNSVSVIDLETVGLIDAKSKSYVEVDDFGRILNIIEKKVISSTFCCGGYSFRNSEIFLEKYKKLLDLSMTGEEMYVSHVIYSLLLDGEEFSVSKANSYADWGTVREYHHYVKKYLTIFCDLDGVLFKNGSKFQDGGWETPAIISNTKEIANLQERGYLFLIITTSRPKSELEYIKDTLAKCNIYPDKIITDLPHSRRVLVNDFTTTNQYPSAISINLPRDSENLNSYLKHLSG